jgi:hypothetical protein
MDAEMKADSAQYIVVWKNGPLLDCAPKVFETESGAHNWALDNCHPVKWQVRKIYTFKSVSYGLTSIIISCIAGVQIATWLEQIWKAFVQ